MWSNDKNYLARGLSATPPPTWKSKPLSYSPMRMTPLSEKKLRSSPSSKTDLFHVIHKVPTGDSPYVRAKHIQLIDRDPSKAISLFWQAINSGDRVDSALKDMAVVMKQLNRSDEAIEAIKSFRHLCPSESQESLDNVLVELYKRSGRIEEEIEMLQHKLKHIEEGTAFGGKRTKIARSQGKKIQITIEQERSRILGNLAWAHLQLNNFKTSEELYRKALFLDPDKNKQCNLALCLMHMNRITEAKSLLQAVRASSKDGWMDESYAKSFERAFQMLTELELRSVLNPVRKEENFKEIRISFTSPSNRNSKELTTSVNGGQENISGFVNSRRCADGNDEETVLLNGQNRGIYGRNHFVDKDTFCRHDTGNSEGILFQPRSGLQSSPQTLFVDKWKKGAYHENLLNSRSDFTSKRMENLVSATEMEVGSACKKTYASPVYLRGNPKVPSTEPRRVSCLYNRELWGDDAVGNVSRKISFEQPIPVENARVQAAPQNHNGEPVYLRGNPKVPSTEPRRGSCLYNRELWGDDAVGNVSRKISFEQPIPVENARVQAAPQNHNGELLTSINESSKVALQKWRTGSPFPTSGDWRRHSWGDLTLNGNWNRNFYENDEQTKFEIKDSKPGPKLKSATSIRSTGTIEEQCFEGNNSGLHEPVTGNPKLTQDLSICRSKKSWADMVEEEEEEEEEEELLSIRTNFPEKKWDHPFQEPSYSIQNSRKCLDGWESGEEFNNENLNSNIICQTPCPPNQIDNLRQNLESFDLKDDYSKSGNGFSSRNTTVRRSLCFDHHHQQQQQQQQPPDPVEYFCSSPLPKKALNLEGNNCVQADERESSLRKNSIRPMRRNRLQVFRDITLLPESP